MIRLDVDDASLRSVRLAYSPLWELIGSLAILSRYRGDVPSPYTAWARAVRENVPAELVRHLVDELWRSEPAPQGWVPVPDPAQCTVDAELERLREDGTDGRRGDRLAPLLKRYWNRAVAPYWTSIRTSLEEEILFRGRTLAVDGPEAMLGELGGRVLWRPPSLTAPYHEDLGLTVTRSHLLLVPTVFAGGLRLFTHREGTVAMSYQARATGYFHVLTARAQQPTADDRLALLLGRGRAQVLRELEVPKTTTAVAESLGLAKSTVSQHLTVLTSTGLVWRQRMGGRVYYRLDQGGQVLIRQLGP